MKFLIPADQIKQLYSCRGNSGCFASNRITVDGMKIGYMYRETPDSNFPDSGWRFFAGDESDVYTANPDNFNIFDLNTVCNYDETIINYLDAPYETAWIWNGESFVLDCE